MSGFLGLLIAVAIVCVISGFVSAFVAAVAIGAVYWLGGLALGLLV